MGGKPRIQPITTAIEKPDWDKHVKDRPFELFWLRFQGMANSLAMRYGGKVYLCGSALTRSDPRDYDIRIVISQKERKRQFGEIGWYRMPDGSLVDIHRSNMNAWSTARWKQSYEGVKSNRDLADRGYDYPFDVQIMDEAMDVHFKDKPRIRMDAMPDEWIEWR